MASLATARRHATSAGPRAARRCLRAPAARPAPCRAARRPAVAAAAALRGERLACEAAMAEVEVVLTNEAEVATSTSAPAAAVTELTIDTWSEFMEAARALGAPVLVDFYTDWCGPCKLISPEVEKFAADYPAMRFAKFNCGTNDKRFAIEKGIKALPTFHVYHNHEKRGEFVGAKPAALRQFVEQHLEQLRDAAA